MLLSSARFVAALKASATIINEKALLPEHKYVTLLDSNGILCLRACHDVFFVTFILDPISKAFEAAFNPKALAAIYGKEFDKISVLSLTSDKIQLKCGETACETDLADTYIDKTNLDLGLSTTDLLPWPRYAELALACLQNIIGRPDLSHAKFQFTERGIWITSLNQHQFLSYSEPNRTNLLGTVFLPLEVLQFIKKFGPDPCATRMEADRLVVNSENWLLTVPRIKIKHPQYQNYLPQGAATTIAMPADELAVILKGLIKAKAVGFSISGLDGTLIFEGFNETNRVYMKSVNWSLKGTKRHIKYGLDTKLFNGLVKPILNEIYTLDMAIISELDPCALTTPELPNFYASHAPMRL